MKHPRLVHGLFSLSLLASGAVAAEAASNPLADEVRAANDRLKDVKVAVSEGYAPIPCDSAPEGGGMGWVCVSAPPGWRNLGGH